MSENPKVTQNMVLAAVASYFNETRASEPSNDDFLTVAEVATLLKTTKKAIYTRVARGQLKGWFRIGRSLRFNRSELVRSLTEGHVSSPRSK